MSWQALVPGQALRDGEPVENGDETWFSELYVVTKRVIEPIIPSADDPGMIHLSIRRQDRGPARDWRDMQRIKNQLAGPEWEGVEIYPAETRKVDAANQYHLFCFPFHLGFGFDQRLVQSPDQTLATTPGAVQRELEPVDLTFGGLTDQNTITCSRCGMTSYNPHDITEGYCGRCRDWTKEK